MTALPTPGVTSDWGAQLNAYLTEQFAAVGSSDLELGDTSDTAKPGDWTPEITDLSPMLGLVIVEISTGVWSGDAPVRTGGAYPIVFVSETDPADVTDGIATPANINENDRWIQKA